MIDTIWFFEYQQDLMLEWLFGKRKEQAPQPPKPSAQQQAQDKWKYDFLIQFLSGPLWKTSILDFVDYNCVVFDSEEENKFEYTILHNKFKELVASLFDSMIQEVGLDDDKLAELLDKGFQSKHKKIFNQLLLADDFVRFKTLMVNRNKALEAEAIKALGEKSQVQEKKGSSKTSPKEDEVLKESKRLEEERRKQEQREEEELRKVLEMSRLEAEEKEVIKSMEVKAEENEIRQSQLAKEQPKVEKPEVSQSHSEAPVEAKHEQHIPEKELPKPQSNLILPPVRRRKKVDESPKVEKIEKVEEKPAQVPQPVMEQQKPEPVEQSQAESQEQRKRRLLQQREKIRKRKEEERRKQMAEQESKNAPHVQTIVLQEDGIHETQLRAPEEEKKEKVSNDELERRREMMRKIKNRIVDDF